MPANMDTQLKAFLDSGIPSSRLEELLKQVKEREQAALAAGVAHKSSDTITINGVEYTPVVKADGGGDGGAAGDATGADTGAMDGPSPEDLTLTDADIAAIADAVAAKLSSMTKSAPEPSETATKAAADIAQAQQRITDLETSLKTAKDQLTTLTDEQPRNAGYRPSQAADTVIVKTEDQPQQPYRVTFAEQLAGSHMQQNGASS